MDHERESELVDQLIPLHKNPDFEEIFARMTANEDSKTCFKIKSEIKRLTTPSTRLIDWRPHTKESCLDYEFNGLVHYFPEDARGLFHNLVKHFGGYTQGVYDQMMEQVKPSGKANQKKVPRLDTRVSAYQFGHYNGRVEERVYISLPIEIQTEDMMVYGGMSSDMSVSGMRIRYDRADTPTMGEHITIYFTGLEQEFANKVLSRGTTYVILHTQRNEQGLWVNLKRLNANDEEFELFFSTFIDAYKGRNRVDVMHLLEAILVKGYQQYFLPRSHSLPLYFSNEPSHALRYVLCNDFSRTIYDYWFNEHQKNLLGQAFHPQRMEKLLQKSQGKTLLYSFIHSYKRQLYFYSATEDELQESNALRELFFHFGANKSSWRVFSLQWQRINIDNAFTPPIIPVQQLKKETMHDQLLREQLSDLSTFALLTDITTPIDRMRYQQNFHSDQNPNALSPFGQFRHPIPDVKVVTHKYFQMRREMRYQYRSMAEVVYNNEKFEGWVSNFSINGLQIDLNAPCPLNTGDQVNVNLPQFHEMVRTFNLNELPYRVVNIQGNKQTLHLTVIGDEHQASRFFNKLIENNIERLGQVPEKNIFEGLSEALRQLYCHDLFKHVLFIGKENGLFKLQLLAYGESPSTLDPLFHLSRGKNKANMFQLIHPEKWYPWLITPLSKDSDPRHTVILRLMIHLHAKTKKVMSCQREIDFPSEKSRNEFVANAYENGDFRYIELKATRSGALDSSYIKAEMAYLKHYASHKFNQLVELLKSTFAVVEINDLTAQWQVFYNQQRRSAPSSSTTDRPNKPATDETP